MAGGSDIEGATGSSYTLNSSKDGLAIQVRVSFTDDTGNEESLTSAATAAVKALLTAESLDMPTQHHGETKFTFELRFSEHVHGLGYQTLRDLAFTVTRGDVTEARRLVRGKNQRWEIGVTPEGNGDVKVSLPETADCHDTSAICTYDKRKLSHSTSVSVPGPQ